MFNKIFFVLFITLVSMGLINKVGIGSKQEEYNFAKLKGAIKREEAIKDASIRYIMDNNPELDNIIIYDCTRTNIYRTYESYEKLMELKQSIILNSRTKNDIGKTFIKALIDNGYISEKTNDNGFGKEDYKKYFLEIDRKKGIINIATEFDKPKIGKQYANFYTKTFKGTTYNCNTQKNYVVSTKYVIPLNDPNEETMHGFKTAVCSRGNCDKYAENKCKSNDSEECEKPDPKKYIFWIDTSGSTAIKYVSYEFNNNKYAWKKYQAPRKKRSVPIRSYNTTEKKKDKKIDDLMKEAFYKDEKKPLDGDIKYLINKGEGKEIPIVEQYVYTKNKWYLVNSVKRDFKCPSGFIFVPKSEGILDDIDDSKGWCVAKYEMSFFGRSSLGNWKEFFTNSDSIKVTSRPKAHNIYGVYGNYARSICSSRHLVDQKGKIIKGAYPMRYKVWKALVKDLTLNPKNWSEEKVGEGFIYSGHSDGNPKHGCVPSGNDNDGYFCTKNNKNNGANQRRTLFTSRNDAIWDLVGNLGEVIYERHIKEGSKKLTRGVNNIQGIGKINGEKYFTLMGTSLGLKGDFNIIVGGDYLSKQNTKGKLREHIKKNSACTLSNRGKGKKCGDFLPLFRTGVRCVVPLR